MRRRRLKKPIQLALPTRGGKRKGAGRPKTVGVVQRVKRPKFSRRFPVHVTMRVRDEVGKLRTNKIYAQIQRSFYYGHDRFGMRMVEFSVQHNHIHLVVEAEDRKALWRGIQGLSVRIAKAVNKVLGRKGKFFGDRYHARVLRTLAEVRNAVAYVRHNFKKHRERLGDDVHPFYVDPFSSMCGEAVCFMYSYDWSALVVAAPRTWLLKQATAPPPTPSPGRD
jgi:REP element-mobilizing transposase RayT